MPLGQMDVLTAVGDPVLNKMDFTVDGLHIRGEAYRKIFEYIRNDQILVVTGNNEAWRATTPILTRSRRRKPILRRTFSTSRSLSTNAPTPSRTWNM